MLHQNLEFKKAVKNKNIIKFLVVIIVKGRVIIMLNQVVTIERLVKDFELREKDL